MPSLVLPPLYAILDPAQTKDRAPEAVLRDLLEGGAAILQLRVKTMAPAIFFSSRNERAQRRGRMAAS
jgi:thiamine monophosphate synthase